MVAGSLSGLAYATGKLHLYGAQTKIGRLLRRIEYQRGVLDAAEPPERTLSGVFGSEGRF